jgi:hypothetical protein
VLVFGLLLELLDAEGEEPRKGSDVLGLRDRPARLTALDRSPGHPDRVGDLTLGERT